MGWLVVIVLAPLVFMLVGAYVVLRVAAFGLRLIFAPVVWLSHRPTKQRIELRHYTHG
jgi:hypothetical protein